MKDEKNSLEDLRTLEKILQSCRERLTAAQAAVKETDDPPQELLDALETYKLSYSNIAANLILYRARRGLFLRR